MVDFVRNISILPYKIIGNRIGVDVVNVTDPETVFKVLSSSSTKGEFLERRIATPAWSPILSIESVDGHLWKVLRDNFEIVTKHMSSASELQDIMKSEVDLILQKFKESKMEKMTSPDVVRLVGKTLWRWMFSEDDVSDDVLSLLEEASWEWRKEIAVKGKGSKEIKSAVIKLVTDKLKSSERFKLIPAMDWDSPECYSVIMQPFVISPMINFSDIAVSMIKEGNPMKAIMKSHPFPILERDIEHDIKGTDIKAGTQVIMFYSAIAAKEEEENPGKSNWMAFGCGPRKCQGAVYAMPMLKELARLREEIIALKGEDAYRPDIGHKYSGRNNDTVVSWSEISYFIKSLIRVTFYDDHRQDAELEMKMKPDWKDETESASDTSMSDEDESNRKLSSN